MPVDRHSILHVLSSPYYGAGTNACFTIRDDLGSLFTTDVVLVSDPENVSDKDWRQAVEYIRIRCSSLRIYPSYDDVPEDIGDRADMLFGIEYDPDRSVLSKSKGRKLLWSIHRGVSFDPGDAIVESAMNPSPDRDGLYPMVISGRLKSVAGIKSRRTVGVVFSPFQDAWFRDRADVFACAAIRAVKEGGRVMVSNTVAGFPLPSAEELAKERKVELVRCKWCPGHEWKVGAVCDVVVAPLPSNGGFPFVLATCMAEGRACIGVYDGDEPPECFVKDSTNALLCHSNDLGGIASRAWWLLSNPEKANAIATNAQILGYFYDKDYCLPKLRRDMFG